MMLRIANHLTEYTARWAKQEFDWAKSNCGQFAGNWAAEVEGVSPLSGISIPTSPQTALRAAEKAGSFKDYVSDLLHRDPVAPGLARLGDIVLFRGEVVGTLAICNGRSAIALDSHAGLYPLSMGDAVCAWHLVDHQA